MKRFTHLFVLFLVMICLSCSSGSGGGNGSDADTTPPTVVTVIPANGANGVDVGTTILATFNETMKENSLTTSSFTVAITGEGPILGSVTGSGTSAVFTPTSQLQGSTQYTVTLTTAVQDQAGNTMASEYVWTFTTADISAAVTVGGIVKDMLGGTVANVTVRVLGGNSTTTVGDGTYSLAADPGDEQVVIFSREGYVTISKRVDLPAGATAYLPVTLVAEADPQTLNATAGGTVTGANNAFLTALAGAFVDADGDPVTGNVDVYLTPLDPSIPVQAAAYPGTMLGRTTQGEIVVLETFGVLDVTVRKNGETLQVKNGESVTIGVPARSKGETPATTNMWYFEETTGLWEQIDNDGTFDSDTHTYRTDVTHLTPYNSDNPTTPTCINGVVQDAEGNPVIAYIEAIPEGENQEGNITSDFSEADGYFCIYVQKDTTVLLKVYTADTVGGTVNFDTVTERTIETGGTIPVSQYPFDCSQHCKRIWPSITIGEEDPGPTNDVASCIYSESGFDFTDDPFWRTCASTLGDLYTCYAPEGRCTYEIDPFGWTLSGILFEMEFDNGSRMESTMGVFGPETKIYGPDPANELCGKVTMDEDGEILFSIGENDIILRTTELGALEIECDNGFKFTLTGDQLDAITGCNSATDTNDAGVECRAKAGTYTADCVFDSDCEGFLSCCGPFGEEQCLQTVQCDLVCTQDADCGGDICCDAGYLRMCMGFNACQVLQGDEVSH